MAISVAHLTSSGSSANGNYSTASITPSANRLIVACYHVISVGIDQGPPTVTGNGLTWSLIDSLLYSTVGGDRYDEEYIFAADTGASPSAGAISFDNSFTAQAGSWSVFEVDGSDVANGVAQTFVQKVKTTLNSTGNSMALTLAAAGHADNRPFLLALHNANQVTTPRTNWTEIGDASLNDPTYGGIGIETQWRSDTFEASASASWVSNVKYGGIAFEIKAAARSSLVAPSRASRQTHIRQ